MLVLMTRCRCLGVVGDDELWVASRDGTIHIRDMQLGNKIGTIRAHRPDSRVTNKVYVNAIYTDELSGKVWTGASDGMLRIYDMGTRRMLHEVSSHAGGIKCIAGNDKYVW